MTTDEKATDRRRVEQDDSPRTQGSARQGRREVAKEGAEVKEDTNPKSLSTHSAFLPLNEADKKGPFTYQRGKGPALEGKTSGGNSSGYAALEETQSRKSTREFTIERKTLAEGPSITGKGKKAILLSFTSNGGVQRIWRAGLSLLRRNGIRLSDSRTLQTRWSKTAEEIQQQSHWSSRKPDEIVCVAQKQQLSGQSGSGSPLFKLSTGTMAQRRSMSP